MRSVLNFPIPWKPEWNLYPKIQKKTLLGHAAVTKNVFQNIGLKDERGRAVILLPSPIGSSSHTPQESRPRADPLHLRRALGSFLPLPHTSAGVSKPSQSIIIYDNTVCFTFWLVNVQIFKSNDFFPKCFSSITLYYRQSIAVFSITMTRHL